MNQTQQKKIYEAWAKCRNCGFKGKMVNIPIGTLVAAIRCPTCGCLGLEASLLRRSGSN
jgi:predicted RNA-binding Zn-ribbon protein involved in translation (DUF1610 family)